VNEFGTEAGIVDAWLRNSAYAKSWALRVLKRQLLRSKPMARIALWGLAYKQDTHSIKNSASIELIRALPECVFQAYDPAAKIEAEAFPNLRVFADAMDAVKSTDVLVIMTPWTEFSGIPVAQIMEKLQGSLLVDPYGILDHAVCKTLGLKHFQIGRS
jgi:UDPglucose 6-dehydrogenase